MQFLRSILAHKDAEMDSKLAETKENFQSMCSHDEPNMSLHTVRAQMDAQLLCNTSLAVGFWI